MQLPRHTRQTLHASRTPQPATHAHTQQQHAEGSGMRWGRMGGKLTSPLAHAPAAHLNTRPHTSRHRRHACMYLGRETTCVQVTRHRDLYHSILTQAPNTRAPHSVTHPYLKPQHAACSMQLQVRSIAYLCIPALISCAYLLSYHTMPAAAAAAACSEEWKVT